MGCEERIMVQGEEKTREDRASGSRGKGVLIRKPIQKEARTSGSTEFLVTGRIQAEVV